MLAEWPLAVSAFRDAERPADAAHLPPAYLAVVIRMGD